jgi:hypothetical protein
VSAVVDDGAVNILSASEMAVSRIQACLISARKVNMGTWSHIKIRE